MSTQNVDFAAASPGSTLDTGEEEAASVRPYANGERAIAATFNRPIENLRTRTEILRDEVEDLKYLIDADRSVTASGGGAMTWHGTVAGGGGGTGVWELEALTSLTIRPFLAPLVSTIAQATIRDVVFKTIAVPVGAIDPPRAYSGANKISVEVTGTTSSVLGIAVSGVPANNVLITVNTHAVNGTTSQQLIDWLNAHVDAASFRNLGLEAALLAGATGTDVFNADTAWVSTDKMTLSGATDAERHVVTAAGLAAFFAINTPSAGVNKLIEGDVLCVYHPSLYNGAGGGRREAVPYPDDNTDADNNLFILRRFPEKQPYAIPVATVMDNELRLIDGTILPKGVTSGLGGGFVQRTGDTMTGALVMSSANIAPAVDNTVSKLGTAALRFTEANAALGRFNAIEVVAGAVLPTLAASQTLGDTTHRFVGFLAGDLSLKDTNKSIIVDNDGTGTNYLHFRQTSTPLVNYVKFEANMATGTSGITMRGSGPTFLVNLGDGVNSSSMYSAVHATSTHAWRGYTAGANAMTLVNDLTAPNLRWEIFDHTGLANTGMKMINAGIYAYKPLYAAGGLGGVTLPTGAAEIGSAGAPFTNGYFTAFTVSDLSPAAGATSLGTDTVGGYFDVGAITDLHIDNLRTATAGDIGTSGARFDIAYLNQLKVYEAGANATSVKNGIVARNIPKAWGLISCDGVGGAVLVRGFNIAGLSLVDGGSGIYELNVEFALDMDDTLNCVVTEQQGSAAPWMVTVAPIALRNLGASFNIQMWNSSLWGSGTTGKVSLSTNTATISFIVFGVQT